MGRTWAGGHAGDKGLCILQASWYLQVVLAIGGVKEQKKVMNQVLTEEEEEALFVCLLYTTAAAASSLRGIQEGLFQ